MKKALCILLLALLFLPVCGCGNRAEPEIPSDLAIAPPSPPEHDPDARPGFFIPTAPPEKPAPKPLTGKLPILMYHHVVPDGEPCNDMTVTESRLETDLKWLQDNGYHTVLPRDLAAGTPLPEKPVMLTFDDGYRSNYDLAYPLLQRYSSKAVISIIVYMQDLSTTTFLSWDMCREMVDSDLVEIGSHTYQLHNLDGREGRFTPGGVNGIQRKSEESDGEFQSRVLNDLQKSHDRILEELGGQAICFAYPFGVSEPDAKDLIDRLFPVTLATKSGVADLGQGLHELPRKTVTMKKTIDRYL